MLPEAIQYLEMAITINPNIAKAHNNLAVAYHSAGKYQLAREHLKTAQRLGYNVHPEFVKLLNKDSSENN